MADTLSNEHPNYYAVIPADVRYDEGLSASEKLLYGEISALSNKTGECWASNAYFAKLYGVTKMTVIRWIRNLEEKGYITTKTVTENRITKRYILLPPNINVMGGSNKNVTRGGNKNVTHNNTSNINTIKENIYTAEITEVIGYLNDKADKAYKTTSKQTEHISARLAEGYSVDDCKSVIDKKVAEWKGTNMEKYLRPETLFNSTKFENYMNEKIKKKVEIGKVWT